MSLIIFDAATTSRLPSVASSRAITTSQSFQLFGCNGAPEDPCLTTIRRLPAIGTASSSAATGAHDVLHSRRRSFGFSVCTHSKAFRLKPILPSFLLRIGMTSLAGSFDSA